MALTASFGTFLIVGPTCFFLGIAFSLLPYDYPILWSTAATTASNFDSLETHLRFWQDSPPLIPRILHGVIAVGLLGMILKLYRPTESNMLFDGASLVLYMCGIIVYVANILKGLRIITEGDYGATPPDPSLDYDDGSDTILNREDSLKVMAASNTILALVLVGVLVLQAGQFYADKKDQQEVEGFKEEEEKEAEEKGEKEKEKGKGKGKTGGKEKEKEAQSSPRVTRQSSASKKKQ